MSINEHWGMGFEVNRDPNAGVRRDAVPNDDSVWVRPTGKVGAYSAEVHENRPLTHEVTIGGILGLGGAHLHVPRTAEIRFLDGQPSSLEAIREGDTVAAIYQEVEYRYLESGAARDTEKRLEAIQLVVSPRQSAEKGNGEAG